MLSVDCYWVRGGEGMLSVDFYWVRGGEGTLSVAQILTLIRATMWLLHR